MVLKRNQSEKDQNPHLISELSSMSIWNNDRVVLSK